MKSNANRPRWRTGDWVLSAAVVFSGAWYVAAGQFLVAALHFGGLLIVAAMYWAER